MKKCLFQDPFNSSCSSDPIVIDVKPSPTASCTNKAIDALFTLPQEFGSPMTWMYSCEDEESCDFPTRLQFLPVTRSGNNTYSFTKLVEDGVSHYFKILVSGIDCLQEICSYTFDSSIFGDCQSIIRKRNANAFQSIYFPAADNIPTFSNDQNFNNVELDSPLVPMFSSSLSVVIIIVISLLLLMFSLMCFVLYVKIYKKKNSSQLMKAEKWEKRNNFLCLSAKLSRNSAKTFVDDRATTKLTV